MRNVAWKSDRDFNPLLREAGKVPVLSLENSSTARALSAGFPTGKSLPETAPGLLQMLKEDSAKLAAAALHELLGA